MNLRGRALASGGAVLTLLAVIACSSPDLSPVPSVADAHFLCDGVPREGIEMMTGVSDIEVETSGEWVEDTVRFDCYSRNTGPQQGSGDSTFFLSVTRAEGMGYSDDQEFLDEYAEAEPITTDHSGVGFVVAGDGPVEAWWLCKGVLLQVRVSQPIPERDAAADMEAYMVSMLPWACGGEDVPRSTTS